MKQIAITYITHIEIQIPTQQKSIYIPNKKYEELTMKNNKAKYKQQDDRLLKRLPLSERRRQEQLRKQIATDLLFQIA